MSNKLVKANRHSRRRRDSTGQLRRRFVGLLGISVMCGGIFNDCFTVNLLASMAITTTNFIRKIYKTKQTENN